MKKLYLIALVVIVFTSCSKDRDFPSGTFKIPSLPNVGTRELIHYWNFNNASDLLTPSFTIGDASCNYTGVYDAVTDVTTLNARNGDAAGTAIKM